MQKHTDGSQNATSASTLYRDLEKEKIAVTYKKQELFLTYLKQFCAS